MRPDVAHRRIESFAKRFGEAHLHLCYHGAFPLALTPDLLYCLWHNFKRDIHGQVLEIPWVAVADLLLSPLCEEVGEELYEMDAAVRNLLLARLKEDSRFGEKRINELSEFLLAYVEQQLRSHDPDVRDFAEAQKWTALAYARPSEAARELALALKKAYQEDKTELVRVASMVETFAEPLAGFEPLLVYAREMKKFVHDDWEGATAEFVKLPKQKEQVVVGREFLPIGVRSDKIKITMLGGSGSGKTCYMLGMYAGMQMEMYGFSLSTNPGVGVVLNALWSNIIDNTGERRWPEPNTKNPKEYVFNLYYAYNPIIDFEWLDYRGDAMSERSASADDVKKLRKHILESSCLFLCVSGEHLRQELTKNNLANLQFKTKANRMVNYIDYLIENRTNTNRKPFPIAIIITKYDYCVGRKKQDLIEDIKRLFPPLFVENSGFLLMICPVSLGKDLAKDNDSGKISPLNLHLPVIFALFSNFRASALEDFRQRNLSNKWISKVMNWISNKENHRSNIDIQRSKEIEEKISPLVRELTESNVYFYLNGKRVKIGM